jgi:hypothetical protein
MIQIELPCCDATVVLDPAAETVRCEACGVEHALAPDARLVPIEEPARLATLAVAA